MYTKVQKDRPHANKGCRIVQINVIGDGVICKPHQNIPFKHLKSNLHLILCNYIESRLDKNIRRDTSVICHFITISKEIKLKYDDLDKKYMGQ